MKKRLEGLNEAYQKLSSIERLDRANRDFKRILITSSFGTTSAILFEQFKLAGIKDYTVHFVNTGFLFEETMRYKDTLSAHYGFKVHEIRPANWRFELTENQKLWETNPDLCCAIKKIEPLEEVMKDHDLWISGIMAWQNSHRKNQHVFTVKHDLLKFHPLIDLSRAYTAEFYRENPHLKHPMQAMGYDSVGCTHCTSKGEGRNGRWSKNGEKTECGLHL